jgi:2'-hydroxyisoflavone reductase
VNVLILGGTRFLGIHLTTALRDAGHAVTHFNRGQASPTPIEGVRTVRGDRTLGFASLEDQHYDAVVDTSGYLPHIVEGAARFFGSRTDRYVFISSISVYDIREPEVSEASPTPPLPPGASRTEVTGDTYGPLKASCERIVESTFRHRATIVRPGLIVGPHDPTDRFTYWPERFARGGDVLAPGIPQRPVQFIDARDLAAFVMRLLERNAGGTYNATSPQGLSTMGDVLAACADAARVASTVHWIDDEYLVEHGVAAWMDLPLWIPPSAGLPGLMNADVGPALVAGLTIRPLAHTVRDTLRWALTRPRNHIPKAGLTPQREAELLSDY